MDEEENKTAIPPTETAGTMPEMSEVAADPQAETTGTNEAWKAITDRFAPGVDLSDPQAILDAILPTVEKQIIFEDKVKDLIENNPTEASMLFDWINIGSLQKAMARNFDTEEREAFLEELSDDEFEEDRNEYAKKSKATKDRKSLVETNMKNSQMGAQEFVDRKGLSPEQLDEFIAFVDKVFKDIEDRNLTADNWEIFWAAYSKDNEVAEAEENGRVIGRNEQIVAKKKTRDDIKDMIPGNVGGRQQPPAEKPKSFAGSFIDGVL